MEIILDTIKYGTNSILSLLHLNGNLSFCYTLENKNKAIQRGTYRLGLYYAGEMAKRYAKRFKEPIHPMLEILNVPNRTVIFFHILNRWVQSDGCIGVGLSYKKIGNEYQIYSSEKAYKKLYYQTRDAIQSGENVIVTIRDVKPIKISPEIRQPKQKQEIPVKAKKPIPDLEIKPQSNIPFWKKIDYGSMIKGLINFIFNRLTGFRIFKSIKNKSKSLIDYLKELIQLIIQKIKGKEK